jgi:two-component system, LytTR family, sensor kinase
LNKIINFDFNSKIQTKIVLHSLVWSMFFSIPFYDFFFNTRSYDFSFLIVVSICLAVFYTNFSYLLPNYILKKKWKIYFVSVLIMFIISCVIFTQIRPIAPGFNNARDIKHLQEVINNNTSIRLFPCILLFILMISVSSFLKFYEIWNENFKKSKEIENESRKSELSFLKAQLNPHFFFNSLNTIYSLSISKSEKTSEAILNLSELMRYMLSGKNDHSIEKKVKLNDDLSYIKNYIELQKLRITENNNIEFYVFGDTEQIELYPLLFISFIENAFKFGVHPTHASNIKIVFKITKFNLEFSISNKIHFQKNSYDSFGLGNQNAIRRLNLYYPSNILKINTTDNQYNVELNLTLNES